MCTEHQTTTTPSPAPSLAERLEAYIDSLGLAYFKGRELTPYWSREVGGARNSCPPEALWPNIVKTLVVLNRLRERMGAPVTITSSFRDVDYNRAVGGEEGSFHLQFRALDFQCAKGTPAEWASNLRGMRGRTFKHPLTGAVFVFRGGIGVYPTFVHVDTRGVDANW